MGASSRRGDRSGDEDRRFSHSVIPVRSAPPSRNVLFSSLMLVWCFTSSSGVRSISWRNPEQQEIHLYFSQWTRGRTSQTFTHAKQNNKTLHSISVFNSILYCRPTNPTNKNIRSASPIHIDRTWSWMPRGVANTRQNRHTHAKRAHTWYTHTHMLNYKALTFISSE